MEGKEQRQDANTAASAGAGDGMDAEQRERVIRETREAGMRAEGGGSADEEEIRKAAEDAQG